MAYRNELYQKRQGCTGLVCFQVQPYLPAPERPSPVRHCRGCGTVGKSEATLPRSAEVYTDRQLLLDTLAQIGIEPLLLGVTRYAQVVEKPVVTKNLFGDISEVAGKKLRIMDQNPRGDCLCLFNGVLGDNLVDVDHLDIVSIDHSTP